MRKIIESTPRDMNSPLDDYMVTRAKMKPLHGFPTRDSTIIIEKSYHGVRGDWLFAEEQANSDRVALFCHGGGFVSCTMEDYYFYAEIISQELGMKVVTPDYRLAPEAQYPSALDDCFDVYKGLLEEGVAAENICISGDSCGGGLAICTMLRARDAGLPLPACYVGFTPWCDLEASGDSAQNPTQRDPFITPGWLRRRSLDYLGNGDPKTPTASPVYADCTGLPPMLLQHGEIDITRDDGFRMASVARADGVNVSVETVEGMVHGFHGLVNQVPASREAWKRAKAFVDVWM